MSYKWLTFLHSSRKFHKYDFDKLLLLKYFLCKKKDTSICENVTLSIFKIAMWNVWGLSEILYIHITIQKTESNVWKNPPISINLDMNSRAIILKNKAITEKRIFLPVAKSMESKFPNWKAVIFSFKWMIINISVIHRHKWIYKISSQ